MEKMVPNHRIIKINWDEIIYYTQGENGTKSQNNPDKLGRVEPLLKNGTISKQYGFHSHQKILSSDVHCVESQLTKKKTVSNHRINRIDWYGFHNYKMVPIDKNIEINWDNVYRADIDFYNSITSVCNNMQIVNY